MGLVTEGHDVLMLFVLPSQELLDSLLVVKGRVVSGVVEHLNILLLETNAVFIRLKSFFSVTPGFEVSGLLLLAGESDLAKDVIASIPSLGIEHVEGVPLILHSDVHHLRVLFKEDSLIAHINPQSVARTKSEVLLKERVMLFVPSAHDNDIHFFSRAILESADLSIYLL
jgi:hypothetical protein